MKRFLVIYILFFSILNSGYAQYVFHKLVDYQNMYNGGWSIIQTNDGGYISSGITYGGNGAMLFVKIDSKGDTTWAKRYDFISGYGEDGRSIIQLSDGKYSVCGTIADTANNDTDVILFLLNENGDSIICKIVEGGISDQGIMHKQIPDGGFIIGGYNYDSTVTYTNVFLIKTNSLGNIQWQQEYGAANYNDILKSIDITPDGGFIIGGDFENPATSSNDMFLLKTDSLGNQEWKKAFGSTADEYTGYAITTLDKGFIIAGARMMSNNKFKGYIVKTDSLGNTQWSDTIGEGNYHDYFKIVRQLLDSSYIVGGTKPDLTGTPNGVKAWLQKLSKQGDTLWSKTYNYYGGSKHTYMEDLNLTNDGGFIATGYIINNSLPAKNDLWLLKTDGNGNTCVIDTTTYAGCWEYNCSLTHSTIMASADTVYLSQGANVQFTTISNYATEWHWNFGDNTTSIEQNPQHSYGTTGIYTVILISGNGICSDTAYYTIKVKLNTGIKPNIDNQNLTIELYPNPVSTELRVKVIAGIEKEGYTITLYDMQGNPIKQIATKLNENVIDVSCLLQGIYGVTVRGNNLYSCERFVKL